MSSSWHQKKNKLRQEQEDRDEQNRPEDTFVKNQTSSAAMGGGEDNLFEKKLSKEEKKAAAKAAREAKKKNKQKKKGESVEETKESGLDEAARLVKQAKALKLEGDEKKNESLDALAAEGTICTFSESKKGVDSRSRDINVQNFTLAHKGHLMLDETEIVLNHGNRYGLIGRNGCGKSTLMKALGVRAVPIPAIIDQFHLKEEIEPSKTLTAIDAVMSVDEERNRLEKEAETLNSAISALAKAEAEGGLNEENGTMEEQQEEIMNFLSIIYDRLDALDSSTAESRARGILKGLGFTHAMQGKVTADFSGGWRMRVSLARALFIQPTLMLLDEPTNHLDMEAVIWLEDYLSKWNKILFLVSHSQDFLNNVCTHIVDFTHKGKLVTYDGNYDQFIKTKREKEENQMKQYKWEQDQIKNMKDYVARFGHGTSKNAKQAQSKEKVLEKMVRAGLTEKPTVEKPMNFKFPDPSNLPPPVLSFRDVSFGYPNCEPLYSNVNLAVDLDSRVALVGPNGAGKTTPVKCRFKKRMSSATGRRAGWSLPNWPGIDPTFCSWTNPPTTWTWNPSTRSRLPFKPTGEVWSSCRTTCGSSRRLPTRFGFAITRPSCLTKGTYRISRWTCERRWASENSREMPAWSRVGPERKRRRGPPRSQLFLRSCRPSARCRNQGPRNPRCPYPGPLKMLAGGAMTRWTWCRQSQSLCQTWRNPQQIVGGVTMRRKRRKPRRPRRPVSPLPPQPSPRPDATFLLISAESCLKCSTIAIAVFRVKIF